MGRARVPCTDIQRITWSLLTDVMLYYTGNSEPETLLLCALAPRAPKSQWCAVATKLRCKQVVVTGD